MLKEGTISMYSSSVMNVSSWGVREWSRDGGRAMVGVGCWMDVEVEMEKSEGQMKRLYG